MAACRRERVLEIRAGGTEEAGPITRPWVGYIAQQEDPDDGEQQSACDHQEAGIAERELQPNAQTRGPIHDRLLRPGRCAAGADAVADAGHGDDEPRFAEAFAQRRDCDAYGVGERVCMLVPCPFEELLGADDAALGGDEDLEHGELLASQRDVAAVAIDLAAKRIQPQAGDLAHGRPVVGASAVERAEAKDELLELERLGQVVVGAELESGGLVIKPVGRGQHEDRHAGARGDDAFGDLVTRRTGDVSVENGDVVGVDARAAPARRRRHRRCRPRSPRGAGRRGWLRPGRARPRRSARACLDARSSTYRRRIENRIRAGNAARLAGIRHGLALQQRRHDTAESGSPLRLAVSRILVRYLAGGAR